MNVLDIHTAQPWPTGCLRSELISEFFHFIVIALVHFFLFLYMLSLLIPNEPLVSENLINGIFESILNDTATYFPFFFLNGGLNALKIPILEVK